MNLGELLFASYIFSQTDSGAYEDFIKETNGGFNIDIPEHRQYLLNWLRKWGMRHLAKIADEASSERLKQWYEQYRHMLPHENANLWDLNNTDLEPIQQAYKGLLVRNINYTTETGQNRAFSFGAIGAAKILFALRPKVFPLWDNAIRDELQQNNLINGNSDDELYLSLVMYIKDGIIPELQQQSLRVGFSLAELPVQMDRPNSTTVLKLIDEYHWITIKRKIVPPKVETLQKMIEWLK